jgi:hypothetical protein
MKAIGTQRPETLRFQVNDREHFHDNSRFDLAVSQIIGQRLT